MAIGAHSSAFAASASNSSSHYAEFNSAFISTGGGDTYDVSRFERGNPAVAGDHHVEIHVNGAYGGQGLIHLEADASGSSDAVPCISADLLISFGFNRLKLEELAKEQLERCLDLEQAVPGFSALFDNARQRLEVLIPQAYMARQPRGYVDPARWEQGVDGLALGYQLNLSENVTSSTGSARQAFLGWEARANFRGWRFHSQNALVWSDRDGQKRENLRNYAQHDVTAWSSQLTLGESFTPGTLFESTGYRGVGLATDPRMRADSMNGYAPIIQGVAESQARIEIRQHGYLILEKSVSPGAFFIDDLLATGYGGDLEVTINEADGRRRSFTVPYAAVPNLLRPGRFQYSLTAGQVRSGAASADSPYFIEGTYQRGVSNMFTLYAGSQISAEAFYRSALVGSAINTHVGAISVDLTSSRARINGAYQDGFSSRLTYSKSVPSFGMDFALAGYRYSSSGYLSMGDAVFGRARSRREGNAGRLEGALEQPRQRNRFQLIVNQRLGANAGSLSLSGSRNDFWEREQKADTTYHVGYNNRLGRVSYELTASRSRTSDLGYDNRYYLSFSMPIGIPKSRPSRLSLNAVRSPEGSDAMANLSGTWGKSGQFNYSIGTALGGEGDTVSTNLGWRTSDFQLSAFHLRSSRGQQTALSVDGGILMHQGGINFASDLGETIGIVRADGAAGALLNDGFTRISRNGYAVVTNLMPYRVNDVMLDPRDASEDVELRTSRVQTVPRAGSIVPLQFDTLIGAPVLVRVVRADGGTVPFGAQVMKAGEEEVALVAQDGQVFLRGVESGSQLIARWGGDADQACVLVAPVVDTKLGGRLTDEIEVIPCR